MKIVYVNCGLRNEYESDLRNNKHYLSNSESKVWKKIQACMRFEPITSAIPVQRSATELTSQLGAGKYFSHSFSLSDLILNWLIDARRTD